MAYKSFFRKTKKNIKKKPSYTQLFNNSRHGTPRVQGTGYGTAQKARRTLKRLRRKPRSLQRQIATTMYYRAKYHKYQTQGMRNAMKVYKPFLNSFKGGSASAADAAWLYRSSPAYIETIESRSYPLIADSL